MEVIDNKAVYFSTKLHQHEHTETFPSALDVRLIYGSDFSNTGVPSKGKMSTLQNSVKSESRIATCAKA